MSAADTASFYDELAPFYHLLYGDWEQSIERQGAALAALLHDHGIDPAASVHDAASGIGTQMLGLLAHGYRVSASDLSPGAIERLRIELARRGLVADAEVDDLRVLGHVETASKAAVIACDNSIPHLLSDAEIASAFKSCYRCLRQGGIAAFSVRDYAAIERRNPDVRPYGMHRDEGRRLLAVQVWEWDGDQYDLRLYLTSESIDGACATRVLKSRFYAVSIAKLLELMTAAGFVDVERRDDVLFQPVVLGRRANGR